MRAASDVRIMYLLVLHWALGLSAEFSRIAQSSETGTSAEVAGLCAQTKQTQEAATPHHQLTPSLDGAGTKPGTVNTHVSAGFVAWCLTSGYSIIRFEAFCSQGHTH